jgi:hypothetical protein
MGAANGIHVHRLDQLYILQVDLVVEAAASFRSESVTVDSFHLDFGTVQIDTVSRADFDGPKPEFLRSAVQLGFI